MNSALKSWELENSVELVNPHRDALYGFDGEEQKSFNAAKPWAKDPHYFKHVRISAIALLKMVMHARSGGSLEIMGLMQGKVTDGTFIVTDAFRLPVTGTETRVNAQDEANEYMVNYLQQARESGRMENAVGWYHSHPGYGCWLSGIDVGTQKDQQKYQDPFLAVVIDPERTISAGKVEIGAFRTFPEDYHLPKSRGEDDEYQSIPLAKIEEFGAHANSYYSLEVSHFRSTLDSHLLELLWNKYWVSTLSRSPLLTNRDYTTKQMMDLSQKIRQAEKAISGSRPQVGQKTLHDPHLDKVVRDGEKIAKEEATGLMAALVKSKLFSGVGAVSSGKAQT
ncbi:MAG: COP9 signalosome catalytic subunit rri1 [Cirrosporium novae-zelandiae]|nr:MAG: COP9 signalosome catalytic subunit rri1 [Cirrosporium novae-zelandiae]